MSSRTDIHAPAAPLTTVAGERVRLTPSARHATIMEMLRGAGAVTTDEARRRLGVSLMTVRRDFDQLERRGQVLRTHGGAVLPAAVPHEADREAARAADVRVARVAATAIVDGESVFLDASPGAADVARELIALGRRGTVITNSLTVMEIVTRQGSDGLGLIGLCGRLHRRTRAFGGPTALDTAEAHFADRVVLGADALALDGRLLDDDQANAEVKRAMVRQSEQVVLLVSGALPARASGTVVAHAAELTYAVAVAEPGLLRAAGVPIRVA